MWKVLGKETIIVDAGEVWRDRLLELSQRRKDRDRFRRLMEAGKVRHLFDSSRDVHVFLVELPEELTTEDIQFLAGYITKLQKAAKVPVIEFEGTKQPHTIILTSEPREDDYEVRKKRREEKDK